MIEFTVISLFVILLLAYYTMGRNLSRPSILYVGGFLACAIVAYNWKTEWGLNKMSPTTVFMIVGGALVFYLAELFDYKKHQKKNIKVTFEIKNFKLLSKTKLLLFFLFQIVVLLLMSRAKMSYAMTDDLSEAMVQINDEVKFENTLVKMPIYIQQPYNFIMNARILWCVLFPYYLFKSKQYNIHKLLLFLNLLAGTLGSMVGGGRMGVLEGIISVSIFCYICYQVKNGWQKKKLPKKVVFSLACVVILFILFFVQLGYALGRKESEDPISLILAIYCGAEIKNLDDYIQHPFKQGNERGLPAQYTFCGFYDKIDVRLFGSNESRGNDPDLSFNSYGNYPLGNVYTVYYNFILDFGYWGAIIWTAFTSFIISFFYRKVLNSKFWDTGRPDLWMMYFLANIPTACFLAFFSNRLYESIAISSTIRSLFYWWLLILLFCGRETTRLKRI